jgi:hypothetical protein
MARIRVYIKPFDESGNYADWIEATDDVPESALSSIKQSIEGSEYDIGVFTNSSFTLKLRNDHGRYSDVGSTGTIFSYKRSDSLVKITWDRSDFDIYGGAFDIPLGGLALTEEVTVYQGLLNDESSKLSVKDQTLSFPVLGRESVLSRAIVPIDDLSNGMNVSDILFACLNQEAITDLLTVDALNIAPGNDNAIDDVSEYENKTVKEAISELLLLSSSVLYIEGDSIKVSSRDETADVQFYFYGQGSENGIENILDITDIRSGMNRVFNFVVWDRTSLLSTDGPSVTKYGYRKKSLSADGVTSDVTRQAILDAIREEFANPKQEFFLITPLTYETLDLSLLSKVSIDYPKMIVSTGDLPYYGIAEYGVAEYPQEVSSFFILPDEHYKIIGRDIDLKKGVIKFEMRRIG